MGLSTSFELTLRPDRELATRARGSVEQRRLRVPGDGPPSGRLAIATRARRGLRVLEASAVYLVPR